jgi:hypothetical protein
MWPNLFWIAVVIGIWWLFTRAVIKADEKDQKVHDDWYNHPDRIWNQWKNEQ